MAFRTWARLLGATLGLAALAAASQLGVAYGLGIVRLTRVLDVTVRDQWTAQLAWVAWIAMISAVLGGLAGGRLLDRWGGAITAGTHIGLSFAAGAGAALVVPLTMQPARTAQIVGVRPVFVIGLCAGLGALVGVGAAYAALAQQIARRSLGIIGAAVWVIALISVLPSLAPSDPLPSVRLGVFDAGFLSPAVTQRTALFTMPALALLVGALLGWAARRRELPTLTIALAGLPGPALLTLAYLIAGPGSGSERYQVVPYWAAMTATGAGVLGSVLAAVIRRGEDQDSEGTDETVTGEDPKAVPTAPAATEQDRPAIRLPGQRLSPTDTEDAYPTAEWPATTAAPTWPAPASPITGETPDRPATDPFDDRTPGRSSSDLRTPDLGAAPTPSWPGADPRPAGRSATPAPTWLTPASPLPDLSPIPASQPASRPSGLSSAPASRPSDPGATAAADRSASGAHPAGGSPMSAPTSPAPAGSRSRRFGRRSKATADAPVEERPDQRSGAVALGDYADQEPPPFDAFAAADRRPGRSTAPPHAQHAAAGPQPYVPAPAIPPMPPGAVQEPPAEEAPSRAGGLLGRARNPFARRKPAGHSAEQPAAGEGEPTWPGRTDLSSEPRAHLGDRLREHGNTAYGPADTGSFARRPSSDVPPPADRSTPEFPSPAGHAMPEFPPPAGRPTPEFPPPARQALPDVLPPARRSMPDLAAGRDPLQDAPFSPVSEPTAATRDPLHNVPPHARSPFRDERPPARPPLLPTERPASRAPLVPEPHAVSAPLPQPDPLSPPLPVTPAPEPDDRRGRKKRKDDDYVDWVSGLGGE